MAAISPNELFTQWLKEWWDVERERNTKAQIVYKKAYQSMKACEATFQHAAQAEQLNGVGPKICRRLEEAHKTYCQENGLAMPVKPSRRSKAGQAGIVDGEPAQETTQEPQRKRAKTTREYVPQMRGGAYAIVKTLGQLEQDSSQALTKSEICDRSQQYCDASFTVPMDATKFYTAWKSMETLLSKELVYVRGHPVKKYALTDEGWRTALKMQAAEGGSAARGQASSNVSRPGLMSSDPGRAQAQRPAQVVPSAETNILELSDSESETMPPRTPLAKLIPLKDSGLSENRQTASDTASTQPIVIKAGTFEVQMLLDNREVRTMRDRDYIANELKIKHNIVPEVRPLPLGDVLWVARVKTGYQANLHRSNKGDDGEGSSEIVLEHIIERKRLDDLISSIKDGRFHEQKFRLKKSGLKHVTYLVETVTISSERQELYGQSVESSIAQMQMVDNIFVKQTAKMDDSIAYLAKMTKLLKAKYEKTDLHVLPSCSLDVSQHWHHIGTLRSASPSRVFAITFSAFCSLCDKSDSLTLRDQFLKFLMCIHGVTGEKAISIQQVWPTPKALIDAYGKLGTNTEAKQNMISDRLGTLIDRKRITKIVSARIAEIWS